MSGHHAWLLFHSVDRDSSGTDGPGPPRAFEGVPVMRTQSQRFVMCALIFGSFVAAPAHAGVRAWLAATCHTLLTRTGVVVRPDPERYLNDRDRAKIRSIAERSYASEVERFDDLVDVWQDARFRHFSLIDRELVTNRSPHMPDQQYLGIRADGTLEETARLDNMAHSIIYLIDYIHDLESDVLNLEFSGHIRQRRPTDGAMLNQLYRASALRGEWEMLNALPVDFVRAEIARVKSARPMPRRCRRFAVRVLENGALDQATYLKVENRRFLGFGRVLDWRIQDNPHWRGKRRPPNLVD